MSSALVMSNSDDSFEHEFHDAPSPKSDRPHSIDLSLALERELDSESLPNSPARPEMRGGRPQSLDTNVLASIVTQLRISLEDITRERDSLKNELSEMKFREENLKDALESITDKCLRAEGGLTEAKAKHQEDEEAISMLRQKVEESRRALMRLQTESRRRSQIGNLSVDLSQPGATAMNPPPMSKRASFTPLTGSPVRPGHRRIVSLSDPGIATAPAFVEGGNWPPGFPSPDPSQAARSPPLASAQSRRMSGMFGWGSAQLPDVPSLENMEIDSLRKELDKMKEQLEETKHELSEAQEAREASESCVRALRTFIADNSVGEQTARSSIRAATKPSVPSVAPATAQSGAASRWGFKLWSTPETPANTPAVTTSGAASAAAPSPVARKLTGFFSPRSSISSTTAPPVRVPPEATYQGSDTSSLADSTAEPVSPASSMPQANVHVQDAEGASIDSISLPEVSSKPVAVPA